jgi:hypothetical protein
MKRTALATAIAAVIGWQAPALADTSADERLDTLEKRIQYMEQRVQNQDSTIRAKAQQIAALENSVDEDSWINRVEIGGVVEIEASYNDTDGEPSTTDLSVATVELGMGAQVTDWVRADTTLLYEGEDLEVDSATISLMHPGGPWSVTAGKQGVPFGSYESQLVSDPLTLDVGETAENALVFGYEAGGLNAAAYLFNGTNSKGTADEIDNFGANIGYDMEGDNFAFSGSVGYINDISDSDTIQDAIANTNVDYVAGWTASALVTTGPVTVIGEYVTATDTIAELGEQPSAWNIEAGIGFEAFSRDATFAVAYQGTEEAASLDLAEKRWLAGVSFELMENTSLGFELANETAYDGTESNTLTGQLAVEF